MAPVISGFLVAVCSMLSPLKLRGYQQAAVSALLSPPEGVTRSLAILPTGSGKTVIFAVFIDQYLQPGKRALVLAHREELLQQACATISDSTTSLHVELEQGGTFASRGDVALSNGKDRSVVVASVQTMKGKRLSEWDPASFDAIIVDEAHHVTASGYSKILSHFGCLDERGTRLVGVTATPKRSDGIALGNVFQEVAIEYSIREMINQGHLVPIRAWRVKTKTDLSLVKSAGKGDYNVEQLEKAVDTEDRNNEIVSAYNKFANGTQCVVFCAGVSHSRRVAEQFNINGVCAEAVWGDMDVTSRAETLRRYQLGETRVLTNYAILTEGWNSPETQCIILARPTKSELVYTQMLGRGLRRHPGKNYMVAIDFADVTSGKSVVSTAGLTGLPQSFDPDGGDVLEMADALAAIDPRLHRLAKDRLSLQELGRKIASGLSAKQIDPVFFPEIDGDDSLSSLTKLRWVCLEERRWSIKAAPWATYDICVDILGQYVVTLTKTWDNTPKIVLHAGPSKDTAFKLADQDIEERYRGRIYVLLTNAKWRKEPASEKQIEVIASKTGLGVEDIEEINGGKGKLSRGDASDIIEALIEAKSARAEPGKEKEKEKVLGPNEVEIGMQGSLERYPRERVAAHGLGEVLAPAAVPFRERGLRLPDEVGVGVGAAARTPALPPLSIFPSGPDGFTTRSLDGLGARLYDAARDGKVDEVGQVKHLA